jgi:two-component system chemotaxis response regulator CheY
VKYHDIFAYSLTAPVSLTAGQCFGCFCQPPVGCSNRHGGAGEDIVKILIVEDECISRTLLAESLSPYGVCDLASNGREALEVLNLAYDGERWYDLVCLDIMMPEMDGQEVLTTIRTMEEARGIDRMTATRVIMTTALDDPRNILEAFTQGHCDAYLTKPIDKDRLLAHLRELQLIDRGQRIRVD